MQTHEYYATFPYGSALGYLFFRTPSQESMKAKHRIGVSQKKPLYDEARVSRDLPIKMLVLVSVLGP